MDAGLSRTQAYAPRVGPERLDDSPRCVVSQPRHLVRELMPYRDPDQARSLFELTITVVPYLVLSGLMMAAVQAAQ